MGAELVDCENVLLGEIADKRLKREDVAQTYALTLMSSERDQVDWFRVNRAIMARWSMAGLKWIKKRTWKIVTTNWQPDD